jgi:hypothetical protein
MWSFLQEVKHQNINRSLIVGVKAGDTATVLASLAKGADPNAHDIGEVGWLQIARRFFVRRRGEASLPKGTSPSALFLAISGEHTNQAVIEALLKKGADPNERGDFYYRQDHVTTLMLYAALDDDEETIRALANAGADVNTKDEGGSTVLHRICYSADVKTVRLLLDRGADPNVRNQGGGTPLLMASDGWNSKVVQLLIQRGADRNIATYWSMKDSIIQQRINKMLSLSNR